MSHADYCATLELLDSTLAVVKASARSHSVIPIRRESNRDSAVQPRTTHANQCDVWSPIACHLSARTDVLHRDARSYRQPRVYHAKGVVVDL
jgi:hypothetical protein